MIKDSNLLVASTNVQNNTYLFGEKMNDGRLTADYNNVTYNFHEMIKKRKEVGRLLSEEEMSEYELS